MDIRLLNKEDLIPLFDAFTAAFGSHVVRLQPSRADFDYRMQHKLFLDYEISAAAWDGNDILGFILHTSGFYQDIPTAYNGGTGVLPGFRHQQVAAKIYEYLIPFLRQKYLARILLEVVETNIHAISLYEKIGFTFRRKFKCYKMTKSLSHLEKPTVKISPGNMQEVNFTFADFEPAFLDSEQQLKKGNEMVLLAKNETNEQLGYLIMQPHLGRISQLAVNRLYRGKKVGESLIKAAHEYTNKPLFIMNIPEEEEAFDAFLKYCGFENQINQFEMELII